MTNEQQLTMVTSTNLDTAALYGMSINDISHQLSAMQQQESTTYRSIDYLSSTECLTSTVFNKASHPSLPVTDVPGGYTIGDMKENINVQDHISSRSKMCQWSYQLTDMTSLSRLAVSRAMHYLDRFLATSHTHNNKHALQALHNKREYQLASMTCLYVSIKLYEPLTMDASLLSDISQGCYTTQDITDMENIILNALEWKMNGPTSQEFVSLLLGLLEPSGYRYDVDVLGSLYDVSKFQCELASTDYDLSVRYKPSVVGLASILNSMEVMDDTLLSKRARDAFLISACDMMTIKPRGESISTSDGLLNMKEVRLVQVRLRQLFCQNSITLRDDDDDDDDIARSRSGDDSKVNKSSGTERFKNDVDWKCSSPVSVVRR